MCSLIFTKSLPFPCGLCSSCRAALYNILRNENKRYLFSLASFKDAQESIFGIIFVFSRANGTPQWPIRAKKDIYCLDRADLIDRVCYIWGINNDVSKVKVWIAYGKLFLKVSHKTAFDYCNDLKLLQSSPPSSVF